MTLPWKVGLGLLAVVAATGLFWLKAMPDVSTTIIKASPTATPDMRGSTLRLPEGVVINCDPCTITPPSMRDAQGNVWGYTRTTPLAEATR